MKTEMNDDPSRTFNVMVAYDDINAAKCAKELCERISQCIDPQFKLNLSVWKLSLFRHPEICRAATVTAEHVVAIVFAVNGGRDLLPPARDWMKKITGQEQLNAERALVALLHNISRFQAENSPAWRSLNRFARNSGMNFFSDVIEPRKIKSNYSVAGIGSFDALEDRE